MPNPEDPPQPQPQPPSSPSPEPFQLEPTAILHNAAIAVAVLGPVALLLPGKGRGRFSIQNTILGTGSFWAFNQLAQDYTGKSIVARSNERWGAILSTADALPSQAETNRRLMEAEKERLRRVREGGGVQQVGEGGKGGQEDGEGNKRGVLSKVWMGDEKDGWKEKRLEEERKALESGKGYADLIVEQIWDVWNQTWRGGKKDDGEGEKNEGEGKDGK